MQKIFYAPLLFSLLLAPPAATQTASLEHAAHGHGDAAEGRKASARRPSQRASRARRKAPARAAVAYSCPMHEEVRSKRPGECPKCGMALERKEPEGRQGGGTEAETSNPV